jgi:hypothetical protein
VYFNISNVERLELKLELILDKGADEYFLVAFVGGEALGVGEEFVRQWEEPTLLDVGCEFMRKAFRGLFVC